MLPFLIYVMEGIAADLVVGTHPQQGLARAAQCVTVQGTLLHHQRVAGTRALGQQGLEFAAHDLRGDSFLWTLSLPDR